jgi:lysophospholipase L1-like esterase
MHQDRASRPFHTLVTLGDSITAGGTATRRELCWASLLATRLGVAQQAPLRLVNSGLGGDVISPRSVGGPRSHSNGYPTGLERYEQHVVAYHPDLVIVAYGVNDIDYGTPLHIFLDDLETLTTTLRERTGALIMLLSAYYTNWTWPGMPSFLAHGRREVALAYNRGIEALAQRLDILYADVWGAMGEAPWVVDADGVHPNNLGHQLIADCVFAVLAQHCSILARQAQAARETFVQWRDEAAFKEGFGPWPPHHQEGDAR